MKEPVYRWDDPARSFSDGSVWVYGNAGLPAALLTLSLNKTANAGFEWLHEFTALTDARFVATSPDGWLWAPGVSGMTFQPIPNAPPPARDEAKRARQLTEQARRFKAFEFFDATGEGRVQRYELRLLTKPVHRYKDAARGIVDGGVFLIAYGRNPEVVLIVEAVADGKSPPRWSYALGRSAAAELHVTIDDRPGKEYNMEMWSGLLILISCVAQLSDRWIVSVVAGAFALLLRELALPFCATALLVAACRRRFLEASCWGVVLFAGAGLFYLHWQAVNNCVRTVALPSGLDWLRFGGTAFVLATCRINFVLAALPSWCAAVYLPLALLGLAGWPGPPALAVKSTVAAYLLLFMFAGQSANFYWGWLDMPLLVLGTARAPASLRDLLLIVALPGPGTPTHHEP